MAKTGRPPIWNAKLAARICDEIASGTPKTKACVYLGVSEDTFSRWVKDRPAFAAAVNDAMRTFTGRLRAEVAAGKNAGGFADWRAAAWLLERIDRESYGKNEPTAAAAPSVTVNNTLTVVISVEQLADLQARRLKATEGLGCGRN